MKRIITFTIILATLAACTVLQDQRPGPTATGIPQMNIPNPASVYCKQNGNNIEIHTAADGSQSGVCVFPDGSTCDEWAYFRGECGPTGSGGSPGGSGSAGENASAGYMPPRTTEEISDWWGDIKSFDVKDREPWIQKSS